MRARRHDATGTRRPLDPFTTHEPGTYSRSPISKAGNIDLTSTFTHISGYTRKRRNVAFTTYENLRSTITTGTRRPPSARAWRNELTEFQMR